MALAKPCTRTPYYCYLLPTLEGVVPKRRLELPHPFGHMNLKHLRVLKYYLFTIVYSVFNGDGISFGITFVGLKILHTRNYTRNIFHIKRLKK